MARIDLDKDLVVIGNVVGDHKIKDIGVRINYGQAVRVPPKQVSVSKDLMQDIKDKKIRVDERLYSNSPPPMKHRREKDEVKPPVSESEPDDFDLVDELSDSVKSNAKAIEDLTNLVHLILSESKDLKSGPNPSPSSNFDSSIVRNLVSALRSELSEPQGQDLQAPRYIPEIIYDESNVVSTKMKVEEKKSKSEIGDKLKALKKLKAQ